MFFKRIIYISLVGVSALITRFGYAMDGKKSRDAAKECIRAAMREEKANPGALMRTIRKLMPDRAEILATSQQIAEEQKVYALKHEQALRERHIREQDVSVQESDYACKRSCNLNISVQKLAQDTSVSSIHIEKKGQEYSVAELHKNFTDDVTKTNGRGIAFIHDKNGRIDVDQQVVCSCIIAMGHGSRTKEFQKRLGDTWQEIERWLTEVKSSHD